MTSASIWLTLLVSEVVCTDFSTRLRAGPAAHMAYEKEHSACRFEGPVLSMGRRNGDDLHFILVSDSAGRRCSQFYPANPVLGEQLEVAPGSF